MRISPPGPPGGWLTQGVAEERPADQLCAEVASQQLELKATAAQPQVALVTGVPRCRVQGRGWKVTW